ncbi:MAG: hypothetical protein R2880_05080 [Deinococcales bacterium]
MPEDLEAELIELLSREGLEIHHKGREKPYKAAKDTALSRAFRIAILPSWGQPSL